jgi:sporulation protein YlmC with PRC-barrel domain
MKNLMLSTAILAGLSGFASAQDASMPMFRTEADPMEVRASEFIGMRVYSSEAALDADEYAGMQEGWEDIGEINDVILARDGSVEAVLVDIGGFLGMGERQVAVDMSAIRFVSDGSTGDRADDFFLVMNAARTDFEAAPEYSYAPGMGADGVTADATADAPMDGTVDATTEAPADGTATVDATTEAPADGTATVDATTEAPADGTATVDATTELPADGTETVDATEVPADAATDDMAATSDPAVDPLPREPITREGFSLADGEYLTTEKLTGARVYDANDEWIGDVGELVLTADGQITDAVIDVGGFLGIGEKPVALKLTDIDILRNEAGDDVRVYVSLTKDQLNELPRFDG